jgi:aminopeptidase
MKETKLSKASKDFLKKHLALKKGEKITIVTDRDNCDVFRNIAREAMKKAHLTSVKITRDRKNSQPLPMLKELFSKSDVIVGITDKSISHCPETRAALAKGARAITMIGVEKNLFLKAMRADQKEIRLIGKKIERKLQKAKKVKITSPSGTQLIIKPNKNTKVDDGDSTKKGILNNFPYGEVFIAPISIADGKLGIDAVLDWIKPKDKVLVNLEKGSIVSHNNAKAKKFVDWLKKADGEKALKVVELGFGLNKEHKRIIGKTIHDEKIYGSIHVAFGGFGSKRKAKIHQDVIVLKPTVWIDDEKIIDKGKIVL